MANQFTHVQMRRPSAANFNLSHDFKLTMNMGWLVPTLLEEVIPGDKFKIRSETLVRFAPLVAPVMHSVRVTTHYFFVPNRILWPNWEKFITANNGSTEVPAPPTLQFTSAIGNASLAAYLGLPANVHQAGPVSALPFAAYQKIYNEYYRDQNLIAEIPVELQDGANPITTLQSLKARAWQHDYFTSALPWAQKGGAVELPIGNFSGNLPVTASSDTWLTSAGGLADTEYDLKFFRGASGSDRGAPAVVDANGDHLLQPYGLSADASDLEMGAATINDLRRAFRLQEWLEKMARGGSRYIEQTLVHFGVRSSDQRLNRPEFIGGTSSPVVISEVLQTSESNETPQANMSGHAISASSGSRNSYYAEEHGYIIGITSIMPTTAYQQGIPRHFTRKSYLDYAWPTFAHIGEQEILNQELFVTNDGKNEDTFGYIPRYSEYRYSPSRVAGDFRDSLAFWHLGRIFGNRPQLNSTFITSANNFGTSGGGEIRQDIFAVQDESQKLWCHVFNNVRAYRKLPKYGTPTL